MEFVDLPAFISCTMLGVNSPIVLRAEAGSDEGGMVVEEYRHTVPNIHFYGETGAAREQFRRALLDMRDYVISVENRSINWDHAFQVISPVWFKIEIRQPDYRSVLWGTPESLDFSWVSADQEDIASPNLTGDLRDAFERLTTIYERFFDTSLLENS